MATQPPPDLDPALYESKAYIPITVVAVTLAIATTAVALRSYARAVLIRQFGLDDWAAIVAVILAIGSGTMVASNTIYGHGRHIAFVSTMMPPTTIFKYFRTFYTSIVLYNASLTATKITFLLQYYRILGTAQMRRIVVIAGIIVALWSVSQLLVVIFTCTPIEKFWMGDDYPGTCIPNLPFWYYNAAGNILTDIIVFVVPLPALSKLNLRKNQKIALIGVFCLGFFTCAISVIRIQYLKLSTDVTWDNVSSSCWSVGELCSGITCACLPTLRPLIAKIFPSMQSHPSNSSENYYKKSTGRDGTGPRSRNKNNDNTTGSMRSIIYPEDVELQSDDRSDKEVQLNKIERVEAHERYGQTLDKLRLGLKPTVTTEIKVGTPARPQPSWGHSYTEGGESSGGFGGGIKVKKDLIVTKEEF
ncbi:hypothetical protein QBC35DRAFT_100231 [Podospora australis]|uniref:Rhodopsin domain-containing protein n=1 Tax=Podospora australis TaxID=1536484 RepID=A0AAN6X4P1_9PEZI|nr:hypothetical protein QBC35DRAFT_100231 [Podospora australis]